MPRRSGGRLLRLLAAAALTVTASATASAPLRRAGAVRPSPHRWAGTAGTASGAGSPRPRCVRPPTRWCPPGMRDAGYRHVVVDDCWFDPQRDPAGNLRSQPDQVPQRHEGARGLHPRQGPEIRHLPGAGRTHLRPDRGNLPRDPRAARATRPRTPPPSPRGASTTSSTTGVPPAARATSRSRGSRFMRDALRATGRPIVYSINPNSFHAITGATYDWGGVADLWRTTEDLLDIWQNNNTNSYPMGVGNVPGRHRAPGRCSRVPATGTTPTCSSSAAPACP